MQNAGTVLSEGALDGSRRNVGTGRRRGTRRSPPSVSGSLFGTLPGMSKISLIAKLTAADGKADELETALRGVIDAAAEEDGLEVYSAHAAADEPGVYYFFELYRDQAAMDVHGKGERMRAAAGAFEGLLAGRPELTMMSPVAAKGLDV